MDYELIMEKLTTKVVEHTGDVLKKMVEYDYEITWEDLNLELMIRMVRALKKYIKKDLKETHKVSIKISDMYDNDFHFNTEFTNYKKYIRWWLWFNPEQTTVD